MLGASTILLGAATGIGTDILIKVGGGAGVIAIVGLLLTLPLFLGHRREIQRLLRWQELEPGRGDSGPDQGIPATSAGPAASAAVATGLLTPAERVTADRPALERITAERAAIQSPSFWRRLIARGPRHPLVLAGLALVLAVGAVAVVALTGTVGNNEPDTAGKFDRTSVNVAVLNGSSKKALAGKVADSLVAAGFETPQTGVTAASAQTVVLYAKGNKKAARVLQRELGVNVVQELNRDARAAAPDADVVVIAGEDYAKA